MSDSMWIYKQTHHCGRCGKMIPAGTPCVSDRISRRVEYFCNEEHANLFRAAHQAAQGERGY